MLIGLRRYGEAAEVLSLAIASDPDWAYPRCLLAQCQLELGDVKTALETASAAVGLQPDAEQAHRLRAYALCRLNRFGEATQAAEQAVASAPMEMRGYVVLCDVLLADNKVARAQSAAETAVRLDPAVALTHNVLGRVALARKQPAEAERHFRAALSVEPTNPDALNNLGVAMLRQGRRKQAVHHFAEASKLDPRSSLASRNAHIAASSASGVGFLLIFALLVFALTQANLGAATLPAIGGVCVAVGFRLWPMVNRNPDVGDPRASRKQLREIRRRTEPKVRIRWLLRALLLVIVLFIGAVTTIAGLTAWSDGKLLDGSVALVAGIGLTGWFLWRQKNR